MTCPVAPAPAMVHRSVRWGITAACGTCRSIRYCRLSPPLPVRRSRVRFVLGIDIGGTNLVVGSVAEDGSMLHALDSEPTHAEAGQTDVLERLIALAKRTLERTKREVPGSEVVGLGVGAPGPLDTKSGIVLLT